MLLQRTGLYHLSPTLLGDTTFLIYENININIRLDDVILMRMRYEYRRICRSNARQGIAPIDLYAWGVLWGEIGVISRGDATFLNYEHIIIILIGVLMLIRMRYDVYAPGHLVH